MKNKTRHKLILFVALVFVSLLAQAQIVKLDPQNFEKKLQSLTNPVLVDVRTSIEFNQGHLKNAVLIDFNSADFKSRLSKLDKTKPVFVYCAVGGRSNAAVSILSETGFKEIYDLQGGISAWQRANKPITK
ncbi:MAG: rhodanese-like domain-containing protein [Cyclobacteriaceae bacterium]|nr:rhodanese-like domain-containing protein [Cyclobacteriaceae bacterium]